jgi:hypothetical protein
LSFSLIEKKFLEITKPPWKKANANKTKVYSPSITLLKNLAPAKLSGLILQTIMATVEQW